MLEEAHGEIKGLERTAPTPKDLSHVQVRSVGVSA